MAIAPFGVLDLDLWMQDNALRQRTQRISVWYGQAAAIRGRFAHLSRGYFLRMLAQMRPAFAERLRRKYPEAVIELLPHEEATGHRIDFRGVGHSQQEEARLILLVMHDVAEAEEWCIAHPLSWYQEAKANGSPPGWH